MRPGSEYLGAVPTGAKIVRSATIKDHIDDPSRVVLVEHPDGSQHWLHVPVFGHSPAMDALAPLNEINATPADQLMKAAAAYVDERLANPNDEWWD